MQLWHSNPTAGYDIPTLEITVHSYPLLGMSWGVERCMDARYRFICVHLLFVCFLLCIVVQETK